MDEEQIITLFFARSEQAIEALDAKYGKLFHSLSYHIVNDRQDADECVNDAYLGVPPIFSTWRRWTKSSTTDCPSKAS